MYSIVRVYVGSDQYRCLLVPSASREARCAQSMWIRDIMVGSWLASRACPIVRRWL